MTIEHPLLLLLVLLLPLLWLMGKCGRKRFRAFGFAKFSSLQICTEVPLYKKILVISPKLLFALALVIVIIALSNPQGQIYIPKQIEKGYRISLAFDISGSMSGKRLGNAQIAAINLVKKQERNIFSVLPFNETALFPQGVSFTKDTTLVIRAIDGMSAFGSTAIGDGLLGAIWNILSDVYLTNNLMNSELKLLSFEELAEILREDDDRKISALARSITRDFGEISGSFVIAITDEGSNTGIDPQKIIRFSGRIGIPIYLITVKTSDVPALSRTIKENGGLHLRASSSEEIQELYETIAKLRPTRIEEIIVPEKKSFRPGISIAIFIVLVVAFIIRSSFIVLE